MARTLANRDTVTEGDFARAYLPHLHCPHPRLEPNNISLKLLALVPAAKKDTEQLGAEQKHEE